MDPLWMIVSGVIVAVATALTGFNIKGLLAAWAILPFAIAYLRFFIIATSTTDAVAVSLEAQSTISTLIELMPDILVGEMYGAIVGMIADPIIRGLGRASM